MPNPSLLRTDIRDNVAVVTLNRPDKRNALSDDLIDALYDFFIKPRDDVSAVVIHGAGEHFCAGLDLTEMLEKRARPTTTVGRQRRSRNWHRAFELIQFGEVPVVCALHGGVIGGGLELAASCHVRVAERSTFFQLPEGQRGIFVGGGGSVRIPRIIGAGRVVEMMLTGRKYDAAEGQSLGLSHYVVDDGQGLAKAMELAQAIAGNAPASNYAIINGVSRIAEMGHAEGLFAENMVASLTGADASERINKFFAQRRSDREAPAEVKADEAVAK